ncbi:MAG: ribosome silencing factor [Candidatus Eisenbacteria bacterium]|nr:ribosome silencing factor [Candidatus Eisenbacteria bacterium]
MSSIAGAEPLRPRRTGKVSIDTHAVAIAAAREAQKKKARDIVVLDLRQLTGVCDYFIIATGQSDTQVRAIADQVEDGMKELGHRVWHVEGHSTGRWVLLDFVDVVVHVFNPDARDLYQLEKLWRDAGREEIADD